MPSAALPQKEPQQQVVPPPPAVQSSFASVLAYLDEVESEPAAEWAASVVSSPARSIRSESTAGTFGTLPEGTVPTAAAYGNLRGKARGLRAALDAARTRVADLEQREAQQHKAHARELEAARAEASTAADKVRAATEEVNARNVAFMDRLLADKDSLSAKCDQLMAAMTPSMSFS